MEIKNRKFLVVGMGVSGVAAARFLKRRGAEVTITDRAPADRLKPHLAEVEDLGVKLELGGHSDESFAAVDVIIASPGVPLTITPLRRAAEAGIPVMGEIELAAALISKPIVAVTGTNGKTTVTTLVGEMLKQSGKHVFVGGNIGKPLIGFIDKGENADVAVVEVSSFQLDGTYGLRPSVAVLLNIAEDHLDRYDTFNDYVRSKGRIFAHQETDDTAVLNGSDFHVLQAAKTARSRKCYFNGGHKISNGSVSRDGGIDIWRDGNRVGGIDIRQPYLLAPHNLENVSAAVLAALSAGGTMAGVQAAIDEFKGLPHRLEFVDTVDRVDYFNDSKATNPDAVRRALEWFPRPVVLLMGGQDKGCDYGVLKNVIREHARAVVLFGAAQEKIQLAINGAAQLRSEATLAGAVRRARSLAEAGDAVLLSPACSSFDAYESYARRGEDFRRIVGELKGETDESAQKK
ncbi:MAG: UDP-N-acetylmuramoyl-L-alanine--D-glutamate ligase [Thermodesulfobacteriota bacterium]